MKTSVIMIDDVKKRKNIKISIDKMTSVRYNIKADERKAFVLFMRQ